MLGDKRLREGNPEASFKPRPTKPGDKLSREKPYAIQLRWRTATLRQQISKTNPTHIKQNFGAVPGASHLERSSGD